MRWFRLRLRSVGGGLGLLCVWGAQADALDQPLALGDRAPLSQLHGLPASRGDVLAPGRAELRVAYDVANNFVDAGQDGELLHFDGETQRVEIGWRAGFDAGWEVGATLPLVQHGAGYLDAFIEGWHAFWGLPDGQRPDSVRNRFGYRYQRDGAPGIDIDDRTGGIGDLQLQASRRLWRGADTAVLMSLTFSLPTGDADRLTGDGTTSTDLMLTATADDLWSSGLRGYVNAGMLWLPDGDVLADIQRNHIWHAAAGLSWPATSSLALKLQLETHKAFYRSVTRPLGNDSIMAVIGGTAQLTPNWLLDIAVGEDLHVETAPDVTLQIALRWIAR